MSYILEALKKSEQERQLGAVPRPEAGVAMGRRPARPWWPWLLSGVLLVNAAILLWLVLRPPRPAPLSQQETTGILAPAPAVVAEPDAPVEPVAGAPSRVPPPRAAAASALAPQAGPAVEPVAPAPVAASQPAGGSVRWMAPPEGRAETEVKAPTQPAEAVSPQAPRWEELSAAEKNGLIRPQLDVHVYAESPAQRFVLIDLKRYREGEQLAGGGRLEAITPEGVIIEARGTRYRVDRP